MTVTPIRVRRSPTPGAVPSTLVTGELAINTADKKMFFLDSGGSIVSFSMTVADTTAALAGKADTSHTHAVATTSVAGFMSATDKTKLDGAPTSTGTGASGTWGISISGTAANATKLGNTTPSTFGLSLVDDADAATARTTLGLGTASTLAVGTAANQIVQRDANGKITGDGSLLTGLTASQISGLPSGGVPTDVGSGFAVGSFVVAVLISGSVTAGNSTSGRNITGLKWGSGGWTNVVVSYSGTWRNLSGVNLISNSGSSGGIWQRIA